MISWQGKVFSRGRIILKAGSESGSDHMIDEERGSEG